MATKKTSPTTSRIKATPWENNSASKKVGASKKKAESKKEGASR